MKQERKNSHVNYEEDREVGNLKRLNLVEEEETRAKLLKRWQRMEPYVALHNVNANSKKKKEKVNTIFWVTVKKGKWKEVKEVKCNIRAPYDRISCTYA